VFDSFGTGPSKSNLSGMNSSALSHTFVEGKTIIIKCKSDKCLLGIATNGI
jgi:hypothetical protein